MGALKMRFKDVLQESINDKYLFRAVFLAGGPGSGKSFIAKQMFDGMPVMFVNSDYPFEHLLKKNELPFDINPANINTYKKQMDVRDKAKQITDIKRDHWLDGMLPLIIDGTGKDFDKIQKQGDELKKLGYDISMVFVNTSVEVAKERNANRNRTVPEELVLKGWRAVQNNIGKFQAYFGKENFEIIDNNKVLSPEEIKVLGVKLYRIGMKLIQAPLQNKVGLFFIEELKKRNLKYVSELLPFL